MLGVNSTELSTVQDSFEKKNFVVLGPAKFFNFHLFSLFFTQKWYYERVGWELRKAAKLNDFIKNLVLSLPLKVSIPNFIVIF